MQQAFQRRFGIAASGAKNIGHNYKQVEETDYLCKRAQDEKLLCLLMGKFITMTTQV